MIENKLFYQTIMLARTFEPLSNPLSLLRFLSSCPLLYASLDRLYQMTSQVFIFVETRTSISNSVTYFTQIELHHNFPEELFHPFIKHFELF